MQKSATPDNTTGHESILALGRATLAVSARPANVQARNRSKTGGNYVHRQLFTHVQ